MARLAAFVDTTVEQPDDELKMAKATKKVTHDRPFAHITTVKLPNP